MHAKILERVQRWLDGPYDDAVKTEIRRLEREQPEALIDAFYRDLSFGTGGLRGIMGTGTNRVNIYTIRTATQGLANYLLKQAFEEPRRVFIGYDVRNHSRLFAEETARVLAGNGIEAYLTKEICPTPLASFGCRYYRCSAAVMITASHNPPEYNGYKVYWSDGAQVVPPQDEGIINEVRLVQSPEQVQLADISHHLIHWIGGEIDEEYLAQLERLKLQNSKGAVRLVYTNLHGTGLRLMPRALSLWGFSNLSLVQAQTSFDGSFPTAASPNPEEEKALLLGTKQLLEEQADLLLATDPDADRVGAVVRDKDRAVRLNGHQIACLCLAHIASTMKAADELPTNGAFVKTIVTSELARKIAEDYGIHCFSVLTGFKYIAELIRFWEQSFEGCQFLFGAEESHGYLIGTSVRDKDGISASCLLAEAAERAKEQNCTLVDKLYDLYRIYGVHRQELANLAFPDSPAGMAQMQQLMLTLRESPPAAIAGKAVVRLDDYLNRVSSDFLNGHKKPLTLAVSDVLHFWLDDESTLVIRPSGTEPKIKIYVEVCERPTAKLDESIRRCDLLLKELIHAFKRENNI